MSAYNTLDAAILNKIGGHPVKFVSIYVRDVVDECKYLAEATGAKEAFRLCDRRLQALRKAGKIKSTTKGWIRAQAT